MTPDQIIFTLLHLLMFVYWLGGDAGVFYASRFVTDESVSPAGRVMAAKILNNLDLLPRICMLLAVPTGLALAVSKAWILLDWLWVGGAFAAVALWIWIVLANHEGKMAALLRPLDLILRLAFLTGLVGTGAAALMGQAPVPYFMAVKCLLLAFCVLMGLMIRWMLVPFGPAFGRLMTDGPSAEVNATIQQALGRVRPFVVAIWLALIAAAMIGVTAPV